MSCTYIVYFKVNEEVCDNVIPVELWVRQIKIPGPLAPSQVEMNSVNRMLIEEGVALPIKEYVKSHFDTLSEYVVYLNRNVIYLSVFSLTIFDLATFPRRTKFSLRNLGGHIY